MAGPRTAGRVWYVALGALPAALAIAAAHPAEAAAECGAPSIDGDQRVGATLTAKAGSCTGFPPNVTLEWYRCSGTSPDTCTTIVKGKQGSPSSYVATAADAGQRLGVKQVATTVVPLPEEDWSLTGPVQQPAAPPAPGPAPPGGGGSAAPLMSPFPVVTIAGRLTRRGALVRRLKVAGPVGSIVRVRCRGRGCPARSGRKRIGRRRAVRLRRFERVLRYGTRLELGVVQPGYVGKFTGFEFRRRRPPLRTDLCLQPGSGTPSPCPA